MLKQNQFSGSQGANEENLIWANEENHFSY